LLFDTRALSSSNRPSGYTLEAQLSLFDSIRPLFAGKPLIVVLNKIDVRRPEELSDERRAALAALESEHGAVLVPMSNHSEEGIAAVKKVCACACGFVRVGHDA
jgi:GTP1/Obg family GTP-binding protein